MRAMSGNVDQSSDKGAGKANALLIGFSLAGFASLCLHAPASPERLPDALVFFILVPHTYWSVRFFDARLATTMSQICIDAVIMLIYFALAWFLGTPLAYPVLITFVFALAIARYVPAVGKKPDLDYVLRRKIKVMIMATGLAAVSLAIAVAGFPVTGAWSGVVFNTCANIYLFVINPLYTVPSFDPGLLSPADPGDK